MSTCDECYGAGCEVCNDRGWTTKMRLHLATEESKIVMPADVALALRHHQEINSQDDRFYWATLEMEQFEHHRVVKMLIGTRHTDGTLEREIVTRDYYINPVGFAMYKVTVHP
jgi:hypothetical protein